jgi:ribosome-binding protein aMBF1 (putative translation factor)
VARKRLPRGWVEGSAQDLLDLSDDEATIVEMRVRLAERVREKRLQLRWTQRELAKRIRSTQPRIARLEQGKASIEMMIRALFALGTGRREIGKLLAA